VGIVNFNIKVEIPSYIKEVPEKIDEVMQQATKESTSLVTKAAQGYAPRKYGALQRSIQGEVRSMMGGFTGTILQDSKVAHYGKFVNNGTGIYGPYGQPIVPLRAKFLQWENDKGWHRAKSVRGQEAKHFMEKAMLENKSGIIEIYKKMLADVIGGK
jgi:HK97 gp10 family phage protein